MATRLQIELATFEDNMAATKKSSHLNIQDVCRFGCLLEPKRSVNSISSTKKPIALTIMGLVHGNEVGGLAAINTLMKIVLQPSFVLPAPIAIILGNPWAASKNKRFLERDLNRSFASPSSRTLEEKRAREIAPILDQSAYLLDLHQTSQKSEVPFFLFPFTKKGFQFADDIAPDCAIITHWDVPYTTEGMCSDDYTNMQGGCGLSLELGKEGFDPWQIALGASTALAAIFNVASYLSSRKKSSAVRTDPSHRLLFKIADVMAYPPGQVDLRPGWYNFAPVRKNESLGTFTVGKKKKTIPCSRNGYMLFPSYPTTKIPTQGNKGRPTDLCHILAKISSSDLPV